MKLILLCVWAEPAVLVSTKTGALNITHQLQPAIKLESTYKTYGSGKSKTQVLIGLNMEVPKGQIYGLLGN